MIGCAPIGEEYGRLYRFTRKLVNLPEVDSAETPREHGYAALRGGTGWDGTGLVTCAFGSNQAQRQLPWLFCKQVGALPIVSTTKDQVRSL